MCGIIGMVGYQLSEAQLRRAVASLHHRGPDAEGLYVDAERRIGFGHARLAIIDRQTGNQPLKDESGDLVLVCNGEIYDFERIREDLLSRGYRFATRSDSEVILYLYREYGMDFVHHLRGEFAFLLYDRVAQEVLAVRDRFGIKPLFFHTAGGRYLFASEAKGIFATGLFKPEVDVTALRDYMCSVIPDSVFKGIQVVPPGCMLKISLRESAHQVLRYWDLDLPADADSHGVLSLEESVHTVRRHLDEAVRLRLRADVPVGVYLSGGLDSAAIAATAARLHSGPLKAFTVAFPTDDRFDELPMARKFADQIGAELHAVSCDSSVLLANMEACLWFTEQPFANFHGVGKFLLSKLAREQVTVVLTGEGADEVFLGYDYFQPDKRSTLERVGKWGRAYRLLGQAQADGIVSQLGFLPIKDHVFTFSPLFRSQLNFLFARRHHRSLGQSHPMERLRRRLPNEQIAGRSVVKKIQYFSFKSFLAPYILSTLGDRQEMAHSVEGRTPFLDHHLFEAVRRIPDQQKIRNGVEKYVLREAVRDRVTSDIIAREKWPYRAPPTWIQKGADSTLDDLLDRYCSKPAIEAAGIFNYRALRTLQWLDRLLFRDGRLKRLLHEVFTFVLSVQILEKKYVQDFDLICPARIGAAAR